MTSLDICFRGEVISLLPAFDSRSGPSASLIVVHQGQGNQPHLFVPSVLDGASR